MDNVGENIREYRKFRGYTQQQLAEMIGVSIMSIRRYEANDRSPSKAIIEKISETLCIDELALTDQAAYKRRCEINFAYIDYPMPPELQTTDGNRLVNAYLKMNAIGQQRAASVVEDLAKIPEYQEGIDSDE